MAELADAPDLGSGAREGVGVRVPPFAPQKKRPLAAAVFSAGPWQVTGKHQFSVRRILHNPVGGEEPLSPPLGAASSRRLRRRSRWCRTGLKKQIHRNEQRGAANRSQTSGDRLTSPRRAIGSPRFQRQPFPETRPLPSPARSQSDLSTRPRAPSAGW